MNKRRIAGVALFLIAVGGLLGLGYQTRNRSSAGGSITTVGSTALQPLVEAAGEQFSGDHLGVFINVQGGGSGTGLSQIQEGAVAIGNSDVFAEEQSGIHSHNLVDHRVAVVGIVPIINKEVGLKTLTTAQLQKVFDGTYTNWRELGGKNVPITIVNRAQGSGTRATFEKWALRGHRVKTAQEQDSSGMVRSIVSTTPGAISYVAFSYANKTVQKVAINGVAPTNQNVTSNKWQVWSYEHMYTNGRPTGVAKSFLNYIESPKIQSTLVRQLGYISISQMHVERDVKGRVTVIR
ncbi:MAG: phosphate ABC transporter substrate-binding protein PstS family protein [Furfurilactobacillus sp.]|jgi:phosphate transport system substrate-binding protein|uniref:Phosphate-binding protein n=1 Tax=Furfurilactobacillus milii TaxID=2888272 RepID=A0ABT6DDY5_9LACO|nr:MULTISPECIES: phosphate ABC transporter substrate-binding protein PstS family protein [Furfurilactobacillus]QLE67115.1 Phosphate ABC transporter periplasmic phosphate-binding protein PstS1 [Furfurilactobacillus rossiae]MCF6161470.1 phosphate ABC transporter substrate-binding protein PstS family protein [Furfurilactobacillus milii]MCF6163849.1 phosphate ABC transporter substrate-binding protein PstS family protein [Furfurilactobacillus milii]MCF6418875.1 phosphate ABC transporter substrate-bi